MWTIIFSVLLNEHNQYLKDFYIFIAPSSYDILSEFDITNNTIYNLKERARSNSSLIQFKYWQADNFYLNISVSW